MDCTFFTPSAHHEVALSYPEFYAEASNLKNGCMYRYHESLFIYLGILYTIKVKGLLCWGGWNFRLHYCNLFFRVGVLSYPNKEFCFPLMSNEFHVVRFCNGWIIFYHCSLLFFMCNIAFSSF